MSDHDYREHADTRYDHLDDDEANPSGIHCVECSVAAPCAACQRQIDADNEFLLWSASSTSACASDRRIAVANAWDAQVYALPPEMWCNWRESEPPWIAQLRPFFNLTMHQLTLMVR